MQSRPLRTAVLAGLSAVMALWGCAQDPGTHASFKAVEATPPPDAGSTGGGGSGGGGGGGSSNVDAGPRTDGTTSGCGMDPNQGSNYTQYHISVAGPDLDGSGKP